MDREMRARAVRTMKMIQADAEADTSRREGMPFTGKVVSEALGEICAQIACLAKVIEMMLEEEG